MSKLSTERRAHARFDRTFPLEGRPEGDGEAARMVASNLSLGGLYCSSSRGYDEMTRLAVRLMLPADGDVGGSTPLDLEAVVVRSRELPASNGDSRFELALFFTRLGDDERQRIGRYLAQG